MHHLISGRWPQFKKQWLAIFYICVTQPMFMFNWPFCMRLPSPWNYIWATIISIAVIIGTSLLFLFPEFTAQAMVLQYENNPNYSRIFRPFSRGGFFLWTGMYIGIWHYDWYGMSNYWYFVMYVHALVLFFLMYRSIIQYIEETKIRT